MAALQKTWSGDLTWSIAKNLYAASRTADAYRQDSKGIMGLSLIHI